MTKSIKITVDGKIYFVKLRRSAPHINFSPSVIVTISRNTEKSRYIEESSISFSNHPASEIEANITKFFELFNENIAKEWVYDYLIATPPNFPRSKYLNAYNPSVILPNNQ